jgi:hypothetical protein
VKAELEAYLEKLGLSWTEDPSNRDPKFRRNFVRERIVPLFRSLNPRFEEAVGRGALIARDEEAFWRIRLSDLEDRLVRPAPERALLKSSRKPRKSRSSPNPPGPPAPSGPLKPESGRVRAQDPGSVPSEPLPVRSGLDPEAGFGEDAVSSGYSGRFEVDLAGFLELHAAERRRLLGRLIRKVRLPGASGGEPPQLASVESALSFVMSGKTGGVDLPSGRRIERRGGSLYIGPASRYPAVGRG